MYWNLQESEKYIKELDKVGHRVAKLTEVNEQLQFDIDTMRRRYCDTFPDLLVIVHFKYVK